MRLYIKDHVTLSGFASDFSIFVFLLISINRRKSPKVSFINFAWFIIKIILSLWALLSLSAAASGTPCSSASEQTVLTPHQKKFLSTPVKVIYQVFIGEFWKLWKISRAWSRTCCLFFNFLFDFEESGVYLLNSIEYT